MNQLYILLLVLWSAFNPSDVWDPDEHSTDPRQKSVSESHQPAAEYSQFLRDEEMDYEFVLEYKAYDWEHENEDAPEPIIKVYQQIEDRKDVTVMCKFGKTHNTYKHTFDLSVESELNYTMEILKCSSSDYLEIRVFMVTVSPPASFTCVHNIDSRSSRSQNYNYSGSVLDRHEEGVSSFYICISSFIAVGLFIITAAVIMTIIKSKIKADTNTTAVADNDYLEA